MAVQRKSDIKNNEQPSALLKIRHQLVIYVDLM